MIREVTDALVAHLRARTPDLGDWVVLNSLSNADTAPATGRLAVAVIAVEEHDHLRNRPPVATADGYRRAPLALRLHYLMTYTGPHDEALIRLARVIQVFHTTPILGPADLPTDVAAEVARLTIRLRTTTPDERNQVWTALGRPARLALFYEVDVAPVDLLEGADGWGRVTEHRIDYVGVPRPLAATTGGTL